MQPEPAVECSVCKMPLVEGCRNAPDVLGGGIIHEVRGDDLIAVTCPNMAIIRLRERLRAIEPQLLLVSHDAKTPLYQRGKVDWTVRNLFLQRTAWKTLLRHLKWIVAIKDLFIRVTTDRALIDVYVGNRSVKNRLKSQLELGESGELTITNSIEDLLAGPDLAIIRLGEVIHPNRAAANILHEALLLRTGLGKPTWLIEPPGSSFVPWSKSDFGVPTGMICCNDDVLALVNERFDSLHLPPLEGEDERPAPVVDPEDGEVTIEGPSDFGETLPDVLEGVGDDQAPVLHRPSPAATPTMQNDITDDEIDALQGHKRKFSSKFTKRRF